MFSLKILYLNPVYYGYYVNVLMVAQRFLLKNYRKPLKWNAIIPFKSDHAIKYNISAFSLFM